MRDAPRRLPLIALGALGAVISLILLGNHVYHGRESLFGLGESPAGRVSLKDTDLPRGMTLCTASGRPQGKGGDELPYGATDARSVVYADACNLPPSPRYAFSWVLEFDGEPAAVAAYKAFMGSQDCTVARGCADWGMGPNFNVSCGTPQGPGQSGSGSCLGTWQRKAFLLTFVGYMDIGLMKKAVLNMDARAQQIS